MVSKKYSAKDMLFSLDIGTRSVIGTVGIINNKKVEIIAEKYLEHQERAMVDGQIHDINLVSKVVMEVKESLENELGVKLKDVSIAAAGRFLRTSDSNEEIELNGDEEINKDIIRGLELSAVKKAEDQIKNTTEGKLYCVGYTVKEYYLNSFVISNLLGHKGEKIGAAVIATFLPRSVIDSLYTVMEKVNLNVSHLTLEPIAAIEAVVPKKIRSLNIALVDIGAGTSDIAISSRDTIASYAMVPFAGDEITEAIAQEYLLDFNTADIIKRNLLAEEKVTYTDVLGMENTIESKDVIKIITQPVKKLAESISAKMIENNGGKAPAAVFLVGGGAHTPYLIDELSEQLKIPASRIAIKDRTAVEQCISDNSLGSAGVTVLGICLSALSKLGENFIDVKLNGEVVSLFNSQKRTVMDVLLQNGISPALLISKNGKSKRFTINGKNRIVFGKLGKNAEILINGKIANMDTEVYSGDEIEVKYAKNGEVANPKVIEMLEGLTSISVYLDDQLINIEPVVLVNGKREEVTYSIQEGDNINLILPSRIEDFKKYVIGEEGEFCKNNQLLYDGYVLKEEDKIYRKAQSVAEPSVNKELFTVKNPMTVLVNGQSVTLEGKKSYIFVDIFNFYDFDLNDVKGEIKLFLNGEKAKYTENLCEGDEINIYWQ